MIYTCKYCSKMDRVESDASRGQLTADELQDTRSDLSRSFAVSFRKFTLLKGLLFFSWFLLHFCIQFKYQHDESSDWTKICQWKYFNIMAPNDQLPTIKDQMVVGPKGDYHWYLDILVLLPVFCIEYSISKKLGRIS